MVHVILLTIFSCMLILLTVFWCCFVDKLLLRVILLTTFWCVWFYWQHFGAFYFTEDFSVHFILLKNFYGSKSFINGILMYVICHDEILMHVVFTKDFSLHFIWLTTFWCKLFFNDTLVHVILLKAFWGILFY